MFAGGAGHCCLLQAAVKQGRARQGEGLGGGLCRSAVSVLRSCMRCQQDGPRASSLYPAPACVCCVCCCCCRTVRSTTGATTSAAASSAHWAGGSAPAGRTACGKPSTGEPWEGQPCPSCLGAVVSCGRPFTLLLLLYMHRLPCAATKQVHADAVWGLLAGRPGVGAQGPPRAVGHKRDPSQCPGRQVDGVALVQLGCLMCRQHLEGLAAVFCAVLGGQLGAFCCCFVLCVGVIAEGADHADGGPSRF